MSNNTTVRTGLVRLSYEHLWEPVAVNDGDDKKYSASFIIPKSDKKTNKMIEDAIEAALETGVSSKWGVKRPKNLKLPLRDGDEERDDAAYENSMFVNANCTTKYRPFIVDREKRPITDEDAVYSGCYGLAVINFYAFDSNGNRGVACGLSGFMKVRDGEPMSTRISADEAFADVDTSEFDDLDDDFD